MHVDLHQDVWALNNSEGNHNREWLDEHKIWAVNIMGSPGAGKTTLLEHLLPILRKDFHVGVIEGDVATSKDALRISALGIPVIQLETQGVCHLDGRMVRSGLRALEPLHLDLLFIENVGNLVCPADFFLGEHARLGVLSTVEGGDKIVKYPTLFRRIHALAITKTDLLPFTDFDMDQASQDFASLGAGRPLFSLAKNEGISDLAQWIRHMALNVSTTEQDV
ncbi:Hydrogenase nickel incorporation protein HypB [Sulfobacillus thermosulfidooxidans DSM 9293]|uniref:Hydrogenase nickel incorporation protein HypB n=1 Tax=Sulfobacillus thermosulfidooxidans (strain DSM 9293 / VKM B-1269 / AT-1) TaxID=929705 RepID=A0A1W1WAL7_SULTA|nr:hydrogenase nickel incorporation protein HypB [Sulfobacillus thermosulfidooxidans]SMC03326.1 Hydrogenase nickel incorporation protein HypB [Sulfobacillus thermosulfidooxidans DSM 9293]